MARYYHRDQPGSPELTYGSSSSLDWLAFVRVLKSCLVHGYGAQAPAGWELMEEGANYLVLRNGSRSGYLCFYENSRVVTISIAETFAGVSGGVIQGDGSKSGVGSGSAVPQRLSIYRFAYSSEGSSWYLLGDERSFVLATSAPGGGSSQELAGATGYGYSMSFSYFGEDSEGNFISVGGYNTAATSVTSIGSNWPGGFTALRDPQTGLLVDSGSISYGIPGCHAGSFNSSELGPVLPSAHLVPLAWTSGNAVSRLRGVLIDPRILFSHCSHGAQMLGYTGPLMSREAHTPIDLGDNNIYVVAPRYRGDGSLLLATDNPEFW